MGRNITIFNTAGGNERVVNSSAMTWGELQIDLLRASVRYEGLQAVIGETQNTLGSTESLLIDGDFTLFLIPQKVKSGADYDDDLIDEEDGETIQNMMGWVKGDWYDFVIDENTYQNRDALAFARAQKGKIYLEEVINHFIEEDKAQQNKLRGEVGLRRAESYNKTEAPTEKTAQLARQAEQIKKNMGLYD